MVNCLSSKFIYITNPKFMEEKCEKFCQSCTMPLEGGAKSGTEADGSKSKKYCHYCYENGQFKDPDMTMEEMKDIVKKAMKDSGANFFLRWMSVMMLPKLERWKK